VDINLLKHLSLRCPALRLPTVARSLQTFALVALLLAVASTAARGQERAQAEEPADIALHQALLDLTSPWTVMCVAAHPDDEDGATLTVLRRKHGVHTVTVFSTFGEGGQNAVGPELYEELGAIRTRETIEASNVQGSEPHFLGLRDFGFSKSADEALRVWGKEEALRRLVLQIRTLRPDVIITNHDTVSGHGHHQATGRLVLEAFDAAADPSRFPEQLRDQGLTVWQPQRLYVRFSFEGGAQAKAAEEDATRKGLIVTVDPNERDTVRGLTYAEQALRALQRHATQGPWPRTVPAAGARIIRYRLARTAAQNASPASKQSTSPASDAPLFLSGLSLPEPLAARLTPLAARAFLPLYTAAGRKAEAVRDALIAARKSGLFAPTGAPEDLPRFRLMTERLDTALALASGLSVRIEPREDVLVPGSTTAFTVTISNQGAHEALITEIDFKDLKYESGIKTPQRLAPGEILNLTASTYVPPGAVPSVPHARHLYDGLLFGYRFGVRVHTEQDGARFPVSAAKRMDVAPAVEIASLSPSPYVVTPATVNRETTFKLRLVSHRRAPFKGFLTVASPANETIDMGQQVSLKPGETQDVELTARVLRASGVRRARAAGTFVLDTLQLSLYQDNVQAPVAQQSVPAIYSDAQVAPRLRVGYVPSFDSTLRNGLDALGVESKELTVEDVKTGKLARYDTIVIDNRGYQAHPELVAANARLLDYVRAGGTLVVFYHRTNEWNPDPQRGRPQLAPYPLTLGNSRVTDENAPINFIDREHTLLRWPNSITAGDFNGWIQERGLYYPKEWDAHYSAPLEMSDAGEPPQRGGLLAANYGSGRYIYTSMVWYRQLRAGVPGAYRMFANIISYGREQKEKRTGHSGFKQDGQDRQDKGRGKR
jgi:LmbE family N-acetylglucosaminyl deacetylase